MREKRIIYESDQNCIELKGLFGKMCSVILWHESSRTHVFHLLLFTLGDAKENHCPNSGLLSEVPGLSLMNIDASGQVSYAGKLKHW